MIGVTKRSAPAYLAVGLLLLSRAQLARAATEPVQLRAAVRTVLAALRRARAAQLVAASQDAQRALRAAWQARAARRAASVTAAEGGDSRRLANDFIAALGTLPAAELPSAFSRYLLSALGAERVFLLNLDGHALGHANRTALARGAALTRSDTQRAAPTGSKFAVAFRHRDRRLGTGRPDPGGDRVVDQIVFLVRVFGPSLH